MNRPRPVSTYAKQVLTTDTIGADVRQAMPSAGPATVVGAAAIRRRRRAPCSLGLRPRRAWRAARAAGAYGIVHFTARYNGMHWRAGNGSA